MNIETRKKGDVIIVDFQGRLAVGVGDELLPRLIEQLLNEGNKKILLNLSDMDYIDSNGLGELVQSLKTSKRFGASLRLLKPQDRVRKTLRLTNLLPMFSVYETEADAVALAKYLMEHAGAHHDDDWYTNVQNSSKSTDVNLPRGIPMVIGR